MILGMKILAVFDTGCAGTGYGAAEMVLGDGHYHLIFTICY